MPCALSLLLLGCGKKAPLSQTGIGKSDVDDTSAPFNACTLVTNEEIQATQGSAVSEARSSEKSDVFHASQCYYVTVQANQSVSLVVTRSLGAGHRSPKEFWSETFGRYDKGESEEEEEREKDPRSRNGRGEKEGETEPKPAKIDGLGDSAYWTGDRFGGALYVLKKDAYLRISIGGRDSDEGKINKSKALAAKALSRF